MITITQKQPEQPKAIERLTVNTAEAALMLGISERTLLKWRNENRVTCIKVDRKVLYPVEALREFVKKEASRTTRIKPGDPCQNQADEH